MAYSITSTVKADIPYTAISTYGVYNSNETASLGHSLNFTFGTGTGQINAGVYYSGNLSDDPNPQLRSLVLDLNSFPKNLFHATGEKITFTGGDVKGIVVVNEWNGPDNAGITGLGNSANLNVRATGADACTGLFNGGTGNVKVTPNGTWLFLDQQGIRPHVGNTGLSLHDEDGSGVPFRIIVVGVTGQGLGGF